MSLNRYRLRHLAESGHKAAAIAQQLLEKPDRLIGLILLGNNFTNIVITQLATYIGLRLFGDAGVAIATGILTVGLLIFAEVTPKTFAVMHAERMAFPAAFIYRPLMVITWPLVRLVNMIANSLLKLMGMPPGEGNMQPLTREELRTIVNQTQNLIPGRHQRMLLSILDLDKATVEDIMIPRHEIVGIDLDQPWDEILEQLGSIAYTRLPIYRGTINEIIGMIHMRNVFQMIENENLSPDSLAAAARPAYFVPEGTTLHVQLLQFQREKRRVALVVDEYGEVQGLITLEDLLEEIVGDFTTDPGAFSSGIRPQDDGSFLIEGDIHLRTINRQLNWTLPTKYSKTLNGLILHELETIPDSPVCLTIQDHAFEIIQIANNTVRMVRVYPSQYLHSVRQAQSTPPGSLSS